MILLVDAGNTFVKWGCLESGKIAASGRHRYMHSGGITLPAAEWGGLVRPERVLVANVGGAALGDALREWTAAAWARAPEFIVAQRRAFGVTNAYAIPDRLGADRWMTLVAVRSRQPGPACVVDCGTAITVDALTGGGVHLGGLILPGLQLMRSSLVQRSAGVRLDFAPGERGALEVAARDTRDAVLNGTLYAAVAFVERAARDLERSLGKGLRRVITGGDAGQLLPLLEVGFAHEPDLVLQGLAVAAGVGP